MPGSTVLLIDDSASVREVIRVALESEGYRLLDAAVGEARGAFTAPYARRS